VKVPVCGTVCEATCDVTSPDAMMRAVHCTEHMSDAGPNQTTVVGIHRIVRLLERNYLKKLY
jgi:hypothetical protein